MSLQVGEPAIKVEQTPAKPLCRLIGRDPRATRDSRRAARRVEHVQQHGADSKVAAKRVLLRCAADISLGHAVKLVVRLLTDGGHEVDLEAFGRRANNHVCLSRVHILVFRRVRQDCCDRHR
eukprot:scaffold104820_cov32-Tisochrysis_lutea.AAC.2